MMRSDKSIERPFSVKEQLVSPAQALEGRSDYRFSVEIPNRVLGGNITEVTLYPHKVILGMGCFWGAERLFWRQPGVLQTAVGYAGGYTPFPTYEEVCSGQTGHTEVVVVAYDPEKVKLGQLLALFWENHDPTQGMRQGNDRGIQYRSALYCQSGKDLQQALESKEDYQKRLFEAGLGQITTELLEEQVFYFAEPYHQQYLDANPNGYCGLKGTGVTCI